MRLEYIDIYESDRPVDWVPTGAPTDRDPNIIMSEGFDFTPSAGLATVTFDPTKWILILNRATAMGKVIKTADTPMAGAPARYRWFYDNDVYTYNLLNAMYYIGVLTWIQTIWVGKCTSL